MKIILKTILILPFFLFTGCVMSGTYTVDAYNSKGMNLNNVKMIAEGTGIYLFRNALCNNYPGATIVIKDFKTKEEIKSESPYRCWGQEGFTIPPYMALNEINFNDLNYTIAYKGSDKTDSIHEYTSNNEPIENWSSLLSIYYINGGKTNLKEYMDVVNYKLPVRPYFTKIENNIGYKQIVFPPKKDTPYFETNIQKIFSNEKCRGLVYFGYSKKYPIETSVETMKNENNKILAFLEKDTWQPVCDYP